MREGEAATPMGGALVVVAISPTVIMGHRRPWVRAQGPTPGHLWEGGPDTAGEGIEALIGHP